MSPFASRHLPRTLFQPWVWTLFVVMVLRALVPAGTMIDHGARSGLFPDLVLCPAQTPGLSMRGHRHHHGPDDHSRSHACPTCLLAQQAGGSPLPAVAPMLALAAAMDAVVPKVLQTATPPMLRVPGGPLGSRAPPPSFI